MSWIVNREKTLRKTINEALEKTVSILDDSEKTANFWIDDTHNIECVKDRDCIRVEYNLYNNEKIILTNILTLYIHNLIFEELDRNITRIVRKYYGE